ncbi:MAG TPA: NHL repeat-containing protein [Thermoanaerobaculia bacterium]
MTDSSSSHVRTEPSPAKRFRHPGVGVALALLFLVVPIACRRKEAPAKPEGAAPAAAKHPGEPTEPSIRSAPVQERPPFAGMSEPRDATLDGEGRLWIADFGNSRIRVFDGNGGYLGGWGNPGNGTFSLRQPAGVAARGEDLYVADTWNGRIQYYTVKGEWKATAAGFFGPRGVAAAPDGKVWITDTGNHKVVVFNRSLGEQRAIGKLGAGPGEFSSPVGIGVGPSGQVYVADIGNRRIEVLDKEGRFQKSLPVAAWEGAAEPFLEVGETGEIYVTNPNGNTVLELASGGTVRNTWSSDDSGKPFARPTGLALDGKQRIVYVVNSASNGVSKILLPGSKKP